MHRGMQQRFALRVVVSKRVDCLQNSVAGFANLLNHQVRSASNRPNAAGYIVESLTFLVRTVRRPAALVAAHST